MKHFELTNIRWSAFCYTFTAAFFTPLLSGCESNSIATTVRPQAENKCGCMISAISASLETSFKNAEGFFGANQGGAEEFFLGQRKVKELGITSFRFIHFLDERLVFAEGNTQNPGAITYCILFEIDEKKEVHVECVCLLGAV